MANFSAPKQGQILWTDLNPTKGHEQRGRRPVLVVSNTDFNELCGGMVRVVAISHTMRKFPLHLALPEGLPIDGMVKLEQERTLDLSCRKFKYACDVPESFMMKVLEVIGRTY